MSDAVVVAPPRPPVGCRAAGRRLWREVVEAFELDEHELALLVQAVRTVDVLNDLEADVRKHGAILEDEKGRRANPAVVEARQQRIALARLLAVLRLPSGDTGDQQAGARAQRRAGARGVYGITGLVS